MIEHKPIPGSDIKSECYRLFHETIDESNKECHHMMFNGIRIIMFKEEFNNQEPLKK